MLTKFCFCAFCSLDEAADALLRILDQEDVLQEPGTRSNDAGIQVDPEVGECALFVEGQDVARVATLAEAVLLVSVAAFAFHQKTTKLKNLMWAMCTYIFKIAPETKPSVEVKKAIRELVGDE